jgi:hypothetical protein
MASMNHARKTAMLIAALAAIGGLAACGSSGDNGTGTGAGTGTNGGAAGEQTAAEGPGGQAGKGGAATIVIRNGEPVGGVRELEYSVGEQVRFTVRSDVADEVHIHGYDLTKDVPAGGSVSFSFPAEIEGIFEVELEGRKEQIAELRVNP